LGNYETPLIFSSSSSVQATCLKEYQAGLASTWLRNRQPPDHWYTTTRYF